MADRIALAGFFLLPFCLALGRFGQGAGLYLFAFVIPFLVWRSPKLADSNIIDQSWYRAFGQIGLCMLVAYFIFPVADLLNYLLGTHPTIEFSKKFFYRSPLSSIFGMCGLIWFMTGIRRCAILSDETRSRIYRNFITGLLIATVLLFVYGVVQWATGFNFVKVAAYRPDRIMFGDFYRVTGTTNHPVTFAGYAVAVSIFALCMYLQTAKEEQKFKGERSMLRAIGVIHAILLIMSGGRGGLLGFLVAGILAILFLVRGKIYSKLLGAVGLLALVFLFAGFAGMTERLLEAFHAKGWAIIGDRRFFWDVHWAVFSDHPVIGSGWNHLRQGVRDSYYQLLGYGNLEDKFNAHNIYLEILATVGALGSVTLVAVAGRFFKIMFEWWTYAKQRPLAISFSFALGANMVHGLTQNTFFETPVIMVYMYLLWLGYWVGAGQIRVPRE